MSQVEVRLGVNTLFDRDPPLVPSSDISGNSGPANSWGAYDYLGRQLFVAFSAKF
jgi:outer membrane receptor protein involved in Fe transport